jgi:hypothetical protein
MGTPLQRALLVLVSALTIGVTCGIANALMTGGLLGTALFTVLAVLLWFVTCAVYEAVWLRRSTRYSRRLSDSFDP